MAVNDTQVGGDHYRSDYQHWDFIELNGIGYLEAAATKYVTRWRSKGGVGDLEKAVHYVEKLAELYKEGRRLPRGHAPLVEISRFADANKLTEIEKRIVQYLCQWCCEEDLMVTLVALNVLIRQVKETS